MSAAGSTVDETTGTTSESVIGPTTPGPGRGTGLCAGDAIYFDGACRTPAWVLSTFRDSSHPGVLGGIGGRARTNDATMILVESVGDATSSTGSQAIFTMISSNRVTVASGDLGALPVPSRSGYQVLNVRHQVSSYPSPYTYARYEDLYEPRVGGRLGPSMLVRTDWSSNATDYGSGHVTSCDASGCREGIASILASSAENRCTELVEDHRSRVVIACSLALTAYTAVGGCLGGAFVTGLASGGAGVPVGCLGGAATGAAIGVALAATICGAVSDVVVSSTEEHASCVAALNGETNGNVDVSGMTLTTSVTDSESCEVASVPCSGAVTIHVELIPVFGSYCGGDVVYQCTGMTDSSGQCISSGNCTPTSVSGLTCVDA